MWHTFSTIARARVSAVSILLCSTLAPYSSASADDLPAGATSLPPQALDEIVVSSTPLERTLFESAEQVTVLSGRELQTKAQGSLGATLSGELGIASSGFGPGATRPIIRGLGGDRIRVLENGIGTQDVSNTSPDHVVTVDPFLAQKIEVLRGPAALLYGTSAVGGVVNVFDNRIPEELPTAPVSGKAEVRGGTVDRERASIVSLDAPVGSFAFHFDASKRRTDDIDIPGFARTAASRNSGEELEYPEPRGTLPFSATDTDNLTFGTSYIKDSGFLGVAVSEYNSNYGVPNGENDISIDASRKRIDLRGKAFDPVDGVKSMEFKMGIVDYEHTEFEGAEVGTQFKNKGVDTRYEVTHKKLGPLEGVVGFQYQASDFSAVGEEAFQPPTTSNIGSLFLFEEYVASQSVKLQAGGRIDYQDISADGFAPLGSDTARDIGRNFTTFSQSAGVVWTPLEDYAAALSLAHTERAPSGQELFADGPHVATGAFEIGDPDLDTEQSLGIDLVLRKKAGRVTGSIGGYCNRFQNFIGLIPTGETADGLPVYAFESIPATFLGVESQIAYHFLESTPSGEDLSFDFQPDYIWAEDRSSGDAIPRIPPFRMKWGLNYSRPDLFTARAEVQQIFRQTRNAPDETEAPAYTFLNLTVSKDIKVSTLPVTMFLRGTNLLNDKAREQTSFIKDVAPLPGANVVAGVQIRF
jgi:iron complex outermembrane receptor protein